MRSAGTYGVLLQQAAEVDINNCTISNFVGANIYSTAANAKLNVRDTLVRDTSGVAAKGVWLVASTHAVLDRVRVVGNGSDGVRVEAGADVAVKRGACLPATQARVSICSRRREWSCGRRSRIR